MKNQFFLFFLFVASLAVAEEHPGLGPFTVANGKQIYFAPGNLQYCPATDTWRFAPEQYEYVGNNNRHVSDSYTGWIDLFPWGTGDRPTDINHRVDGYETFVDWGVNPIDTFPANTWRTPTNAEWNYIFQKRPNAGELYSCATVMNVHGMLVLPDDWQATNPGVAFVAQGNNWSTNRYTQAEWVQMESAGALFLPASGFCEEVPNSVTKDLESKGFYWSSVPYPTTYSGMLYNGTSVSYDNVFRCYEFYFGENEIESFNAGLAYRGRSVRLVYEEMVRDTLVSGCDSVIFEGQTYYRSTSLDTTLNTTRYSVTIRVNRSVYQSFTRHGNDSITYGEHTYYGDTTLIERSTTDAGCERVDTIHLLVLKTVAGGTLDSLIVNELDWLIVCNNRLLKAHYPADGYEYQWLKNGENAYNRYPYPDYYTEDQRLSGKFQLEVLVRRTGQANVRVLSNTITIAPRSVAAGLFPNPARPGEGVELSHDGCFSLAVYDLTGAIVYRMVAEDRAMLPGLPTGIYLVQMEAEDTEIQKLIVR
ncbi:MAG: T9SS type A sorting domain-containing protein [Paludibacteraceae bacterium]|nr:T9SS type A sorting domain-containing protein [Paludibacteraceae bacterium]